MTAVIVDIRGKQAAALNENGQIIRINNASFEIGQQIECREVTPKNTSHILKKAGSIAAVAALAAELGTGGAYAMPYGTVTVGGDSSVTYTVNCFDYVLDVQAEDETSRAMLADIDVNSLRYQRIEKAVEATVEQMEQGAFWEEGDADLQISTNNITERHAERLRQELEPVVKMKTRPEAINDEEPPALPVKEERIQPAKDEGPETRPSGSEVLPPRDMPAEENQSFQISPPDEGRADFPGSFPTESMMCPQGNPSPPEAEPFPEGYYPRPQEGSPLSAPEERPDFPAPPERNP